MNSAERNTRESPADQFEHDLEGAAAGGREALSALWAKHYSLLHEAASDMLRRSWRVGQPGANISLSGGDVVDEAWIRMVDRPDVVAPSTSAGGPPMGARERRNYFMHNFLKECRRITLDHNKRKRGVWDKRRREPLDEDAMVGGDSPQRVAAIYELIETWMKRDDTRLRARIAAIKVFGIDPAIADGPLVEQAALLSGMNDEQRAEHLGMKLRTFEAQWKLARAHLLLALAEIEH